MIHIILFILNICSILILAALVIDYKPIVCDYTPDAIALINDIIKDLCIGILTSTIFYYIVFFAIDKRQEKKRRREEEKEKKKIQSEPNQSYHRAYAINNSILCAAVGYSY